MSKSQFCLLVCFWCCWQYADVCVDAIGTVHGQSRGTRRLQQEAAAAPVRLAVGVRVADFSTLPVNLTAVVDVSVPEMQLEGQVNVSSTSSEVAMYGTHVLGPAEVQDLVEVISTEMVRSLLVM